MYDSLPPYFDVLIPAFQRGQVGRFVHLGHWDTVPPPDTPLHPSDFAQAQARLNDILLEMADLHDGQRVLDVGCGFGGTLERINLLHRDMTLAGVNIDARQLDICRQIQPRAGNTLTWREADACRLPFDAASFDRVLCVEAMFHFASRAGFLQEAARVLRPGGVLVVSDILLNDSARRLSVPPFCIEALLRDGYAPWPDFWGDEGALADLAHAAGLEVTRTIDATANTLPSHRFIVPASLDERHDPGDPTLRANLMLRWLHSHGHLRYHYVRLQRS
jgi:MPBQ/MSBQ methyltransferase